MKLYRVRGFNSPYIPRMAKVLLCIVGKPALSGTGVLTETHFVSH